MRFGLLGAIATSTLPTGGFGMPWPSMRFHVVPPSCVMYTPLPGPCAVNSLSGKPLNIAYVCTTTRHAPATSVLGSLASMERPEQPVSASTNKERSQVFPPSRRSEEHTSELQSLRHLVCRLLLE